MQEEIKTETATIRIGKASAARTARNSSSAQIKTLLLASFLSEKKIRKGQTKGNQHTKSN